MYKITEIIEFPEKNEYSVLVADTDYTITKNDFKALGISINDVIDDQKLEEIEQAGLKLKCIKKSMSYLSYGDLSSKKLREKLNKNFEKNIIDTVVSILEEKGYIDDSRLAARYVENYMGIKRWGPMRIRAEMIKKGFKSDDISNVLDETDDDVFIKNIIKIYNDKFSGSDFSDARQKQKFVSTLYRDGYPYSMVSDALYKLDLN